MGKLWEHTSVGKLWEHTSVGKLWEDRADPEGLVHSATSPANVINAPTIRYMSFS